jgi:hypothetical protein
MKYISLGLQCSVPEGIKRANQRHYSYPFDWLWTPSKTTYHILSILIHQGIDATVEYMTTGYTYFMYHGNERYTSVDNVTESQMNIDTGLGITHFVIQDDYKMKLKTRLERFLKDIQTDTTLLYADAARPELNYYLNGVEYGVDATEYLLKIHELLYPINPRIKIVYFCWKERQKEDILHYVPFDFKPHWNDVSDIIHAYILENVCIE